ncbi:MAG: response regulator [Acidobacteria bacterium]|nr:response regulator [Acidobacteriota bacterium]
MHMASEWDELTPKLLIVDDDPLIIQSLGQVLRGMGMIFFATNGADAITTLNKHEIDLVILDMNMPGMNGLELCKRIKSNPLHEDLPIIFVTASTNHQAEESALLFGAVDFISKPVRPAVVRARVKTHLTLRQRTLALKRLASIDMLTRIPNRRSFDETLEVEWRRAQRTLAPLSLLLMDIDYFKKFNDHYGHLDGDKCLTAVGYALKSTLRRAGDFVARYGGEEFAVILPQTEKVNAKKFAKRIHRALKDMDIPHAMSQVSPTVTLSIGVSTFEPNQTEAHDYMCELCTDDALEHSPKCLIGAADRALYQAKANGRNQTSTFEMNLQSKPRKLSERPKSLSNLTVLLADDNVINRKLAEKVLNNQNMRVLQAANGLEAMQILADPTNKVDLILMDLQMPILNGYEATKQIRAIADYRSLPILALTAQSEDSLDNLPEWGFNDWIPKPFKVDQLINAIQKWTGKSAPLCIVDTPETGLDFPKIDGIHMADAKVLSAGDPRFFGQILNQFIVDSQQTLQEIQDDLARGDTQSAQALLHRLRGSSGSIAANDLVQYTLIFENKLANPDFDPEPWLSHLGQEIKRIQKSAQTWVPLDPPKVKLSPEQWQDMLESLKNREIAVLNDLQTALASVRDRMPPNDWGQISQALTSLDFQRAFELLKPLSFLKSKKNSAR